MDVVEAIENCLGRKAIRKSMPMQPGDVPATWADATLLQTLPAIGRKPMSVTGSRHVSPDFGNTMASKAQYPARHLPGTQPDLAKPTAAG